VAADDKYLNKEYFDDDDDDDDDDDFDHIFVMMDRCQPNNVPTNIKGLVDGSHRLLQFLTKCLHQ
jgi:hypothetical protein